ncbi:serine hydrolase domain-containing protein [Streptomyces sp. NPDC127108]|uniref:serine hydrolase domain-containing protein n=1 Tax=Streptomyces sp. NPDC127108 TaxID=3345361 RepID=UPI00362D36FB
MATGLLAAGVLAAPSATAAPLATSAPLATAAPSATATPEPDPVQHSLDRLVRADHMPAALAAVKKAGGPTRASTAGVGDLATGAKVPKNGQIRIGSNTKTFTAVVMLQLVAEKKVRLDARVDTYLLGLLRGDGIDGRRVTVRQLLQHTSGLPDYMASPRLADFVAVQHRYFEPRDLLDLALARKADFAPGEKWEYSNTNYLVAGLIVQKVTGRPVGEEITRRVIDRAGLRHTYFPAPGDTTIHEAHPKHYFKKADGSLHDFTDMDTSTAWATGAIVSTNADLNRFFTVLLRGDLLAPAQLRQMRATVPTDTPGERYGLGLQSNVLSCGGVYWGHGGTTPGSRTRGGVTEDGREASITVTTIPTGAAARHLEDTVDKALCR